MSVAPILPSEQDLPEKVQTALQTQGDTIKSALARAAVPMPPVDLVATLAFLAYDKDSNIATTVLKTLDGLPYGVLEEGIKETKSPAVLDALIRRGKLSSDLLILILRNPNCDDASFEFFAETGNGPALGLIAANQLRFVRHPQIVRALYYNSNAGMDMVSRVIETAVRAGADLSIIPGWKQIIESIMGAQFVPQDERGQKTTKPETQPENQPELNPPIEPINVQEVPIDENTMEKALRDALAEVDGHDTSEKDKDQSDEEEQFMLLLLMSAEAEEGAKGITEEAEEDENNSLWMKIEHMNVPQKVRLALVGSAFARSILIHDQRRPVFMAVLESPKLAENEVVSYASDKGLNEEIIRKISRNKEWVRLYSVKKALVLNPKTPPITASQLLNYLTKRELRIIGKSHDIPGYISRKARQLTQKEN